MIAGTPGSFKSVLALNMVATWAKSGISTMYFCADSDEFTVAKRMAGIITGENFELIERRMIQGGRAQYREVLRELAGVEWEWEQMDFPEITRRIKQYEAVYGGYPDAIILDNLIDYVSSPMAWDEMSELIRDLDGLSKEIKSHVLILHHAKLPSKGFNKDEDEKPQGTPPADWEIQGKMTQKVRLAITTAAVGMHVKLACVKNTLGPQFRDASVVHDFQIYNSMQAKDLMNNIDKPKVWAGT